MTVPPVLMVPALRRRSVASVGRPALLVLRRHSIHSLALLMRLLLLVLLLKSSWRVLPLVLRNILLLLRRVTVPVLLPRRVRRRPVALLALALHLLLLYFFKISFTF